MVDLFNEVTDVPVSTAQSGGNGPYFVVSPQPESSLGLETKEKGIGLGRKGCNKHGAQGQGALMLPVEQGLGQSRRRGTRVYRQQTVGLAEQRIAPLIITRPETAHRLVVNDPQVVIGKPVETGIAQGIGPASEIAHPGLEQPVGPGTCNDRFISEQIHPSSVLLELYLPGLVHPEWHSVVVGSE